MKPFVVGISGPKDNGKSTLAILLKSKIESLFCVDCHIEHVALPMYQMMAIYTGDDDFINKPEEAKLKNYKFQNMSMTGTELLQDIAQRYGREFFGDAVWVDLWKKRVSKHAYESIVFYPDCRMIDDRKACDMGVWIESPNTITTQNTNHITEKYLDVMKKKADIHIVRYNDEYNMDIKDIASEIVIKYSERTLFPH